MSLKSKVKNTINILRTEKQIPIPQSVNAQKLLEGKVALITGGSGGIGLAIAGRYALPCEVANLAVFMVSDLGNLIVGDTYYMTGGSGTITLHH